MSIGDYFKLYFYFVKNNIMAQMEYKANFIIAMFTEVGFLFAKSLYIIVIFSAGMSINGLSPEQMLMFIGSYTLITGIMDAIFYPNIAAIPEYVRNATLDVYLTKPVSTLFMAGFRKFDIGLGIPNVLAGIVMIVISWSKSGVPINLYNIIGYLFFTLIGCIVTFPILLIPVSFSFWIVKADSLMGIIWAMWDFNNMPMTIYNRVLKIIGVFIFPIFLLTNFAPMFVIGILPKVYIIYAIISVPLFLGIAIAFWNFAIKRYSSASS